MSEEDVEYKRNVRTMSFVLAAIVITIFAAIFIPPIVNPLHEEFQSSASVNSAEGFQLTVRENATKITEGGAVNMTGLMNNTSNVILNDSTSDQWPYSGLYSYPCRNGWPMGFGIMQGYYTSDNYSLGQLLRLVTPVPEPCPVGGSPPDYILLEPYTPYSIASTASGLERWTLSFSLTTSGYISGNGTGHFSGVYTVILADEWGDVVVTHFKSG
ncbi:MAG TPA: hypothetical protein VEJ36_07185 [Nitrososphaerales archaeon]|nr:hypothetical protein [Nitrososphaerales archaeon]